MIADNITTGTGNLPSHQLYVKALASRIQLLTQSLVTPTSWKTVEEPSEPSFDDTGRPIPPPIPVHDEDLMRALGDAALMNGSISPPSIWSMLDGIEWLNEVKDPPAIPPLGKVESENDPFFNPSSVMVYTPLLPTEVSRVELAEYEVLVKDTSTLDSVTERSEPPTTAWPWTCLSFLLPSWLSLFATSYDTTLPTEPSRPTWIPSSDKLSFHCTWWGYRMFLPSPVLETLNYSELKMIQRATLITRALTWFFNNVPIYVVPLPLRPILFLLQRLTPYLGYIGMFISWSWAFIFSFDKGNGVILSATWIVPIALIPSTWDERDWPTKHAKAAT